MGFFFITFLIAILAVRRHFRRQDEFSELNPTPLPYLAVAKIVGKQDGNHIVITWKEKNISQESMIVHKELFEKNSLNQIVTILISPKLGKETKIEVVKDKFPHRPSEINH